jgi:translocator protein
MKKPWFIPKNYGWGWQPARWQGWLVILVWLFLIGLCAQTTFESQGSFMFVSEIIALTALLIFICAMTGERPRWHWGGKEVHASYAWKQTGVLVLFILVIEFIGGLGAIFTFRSLPTWYVLLSKPWWTPPDYVFGPVWTILFALMASALYIVWYKGRSDRTLASKARIAVLIFVLQMVANVLWSALFFGLQSLTAGAIEVIGLLASVIVATVAFFRVDKQAGWLMVPYVAWVAFATMLTFALWILN